MKVERFELTDDDHVPNHTSIPLVLCHNAFLGDDAPLPPGEVIENFESNRWLGAWGNGIFPFHPYHARSHDVLANLGAAIIIPAGGRTHTIVKLEAHIGETRERDVTLSVAIDRAVFFDLQSSAPVC